MSKKSVKNKFIFNINYVIFSAIKWQFINEQRVISKPVFDNLTKKKTKILSGFLNFEDYQNSINLIEIMNPFNFYILKYGEAKYNDNFEIYKKIRKMNFLDFLNSKIFKDNLQTRLLAGEYETKHIDKNTLHKAIKNLNKFHFVGILEMPEESFNLMRKKLKVTDYPLISVSRMEKIIKNTNLNKETKEFIQKNNKLDFELYKYVKNNFERELNKQNIIFKINVLRKRFKRKSENNIQNFLKNYKLNFEVVSTLLHMIFCSLISIFDPINWFYIFIIGLFLPDSISIMYKHFPFINKKEVVRFKIHRFSHNLVLILSIGALLTQNYGIGISGIIHLILDEIGF